MYKYFISLALFLSINIIIVAQEKAIGSWTDHLSYSSGTSITSDGERVFVGTTTGYFIYNTKDNSIETRSKVNALTEINIQKIKYIAANEKLLVIYENGSIDIIYQNKIKTLPFIKESSQVKGKKANHIYLEGEMAYIAFDFGIVALNTAAEEIKETYDVVGTGSKSKIKGVAIKGDTIYASSNQGLYYANLNNNLLDYNNWNLLNQYKSNIFKGIFKFHNEIYTVIRTSSTEDKVFKINKNNDFIPINRFPKHIFATAKVEGERLAYISKDSNYVFTKDFKLLAVFPGENNMNNTGVSLIANKLYRVNNYIPLNIWDFNGNNTLVIRPNGPISNNIFDMAASNGELWTVNGGYNYALNNKLDYTVINRYSDGKWIEYNTYNTPSLDKAYDAVSVYLDPNQKGHAFISTWGKGLYEFKQQLPFNNFNVSNSKLVDRKSNPDWLGVSGVKMDEEGNLWMVNTHVPTSIAVRKKNGKWQNFDFRPDINHETRMTDLEISNEGNIWVALDRMNAILVFDYNGTIDNKSDDRYEILSSAKGQGNLPGIRMITFSLDKSGQMWVGTSAGLVVHYSPDRIFEKSYRDFEKIKIDDGENIEILLKGATINSIAVDGANNKWIGTENSGVYQLSPDGKKELNHFTFENSPLVSNQIISINIDEADGNVYFATGKGIVSYKSSIIKAKENFNDFKVYPNPVRSNYRGPIGISGLIENTTVKITDISGNLVNEFISKGGQVTWNGRKMNGERVSSGVYLIMNSGEDEFGNLQTKIGKILFLK